MVEQNLKQATLQAKLKERILTLVRENSSEELEADYFDLRSILGLRGGDQVLRDYSDQEIIATVKILKDSSLPVYLAFVEGSLVAIENSSSLDSSEPSA